MLAVIGTSPKGWRGAARFGKFSDFQRHVGELGVPEAGDFWGGHAACHALMNGVARVAYGAVTDPLDINEVTGALAALRAHLPFEALVVPGVRSVDQARALLGVWGQQGWDEVHLWLDAPDDPSPQAVLKFSKAVGCDGIKSHVVGPHVPTQSPGCWRASRLPGSCVVGALLLGTAQLLKGAHDLSAPSLDPATRAEFERAGAGWLRPTGPRSQVGLQTPARPAPPRPEPLTLEDRIRAALNAATEATLAQGLPQGPRLWKQLLRRATAALTEFRTSGEITQFALRCDAETNDDSPNPVIAVWYRTPQRVRQLSVRFVNE